MKAKVDPQPRADLIHQLGDRGEAMIWVLLVERPLGIGGDLALYTTERAALAAAHSYVVHHWHESEPAPDDPEDAIWSYNLLDVDEHLIVGSWVVESGR